MRAYLRLDPQLADMKAEYPDGAFRAFVETLCWAEQQPSRGVFRNRKLLAVLLEKRARWINYLIEHDDLIVMPTGHLVVEGWAEWQEGDWKVSERMKRVRERQKDTNATVTPVTPDVTVDTVTVPSAEAVSGGGKQKAEAGAPRQPGKNRHVQLVNGKYEVEGAA